LRLNDMPCLNAGIAASAVDMLICAVSVTADKDFSRYARMLPITLVA
jgi:hypothetical protein